MEEQWKDVIGFEGLYKVSSLGRIKSIDRYIHYKKGERHIASKIIKSFINKQGYFCIILTRNQAHIDKRVNRVVAMAFIPNPSNLPQVNHKDENKLNNMVSNLEWVTCKQNANYGNRNKTLSKKMRNNAITSMPVIQYSKSFIKINEFPSINEAGRKTNTRIGSISRCCNYKIKTANSFIWKFKNKNFI